jgi:hypothetical protein
VDIERPTSNNERGKRLTAKYSKDAERRIVTGKIEGNSDGEGNRI